MEVCPAIPAAVCVVASCCYSLELGLQQEVKNLSSNFQERFNLRQFIANFTIILLEKVLENYLTMPTKIQNKTQIQKFLWHLILQDVTTSRKIQFRLLDDNIPPAVKVFKVLDFRTQLNINGNRKSMIRVFGQRCLQAHVAVALTHNTERLCKH